MNKVYDVAIVGAGAAGLFTAVHCAKRGKSVILYDKNKYPGRKLRITGKGRCNICNYSDNDNILKNIVHNEKFMYSSLNNYSANDLIKFFNDNGVKTKVERGNRVFPQSDDAMEIIELFKKLIKDLNIEFKNESTVKDLEKKEDLFKIISNSGVDYAKNLVIACGGMSYKVTGSNGDGYKLAQKFGHSIKPIKASLVAMNTSLSKEDRLELMGLSLRNVEVKVINKKKKIIFNEFGEMLFTHFGISGPIILSASSYMKDDEDYTIYLDLKPALNEEQLDNKLLILFEEEHLKSIGKILENLLPKKLINIFLKNIDLDYYKKACDITKLERTAIINNLKHFNLKYDSLRDIDEAIITAGGVNVKEIDPKTMESKLVNKLYIVGEVLDIDALTGGYNLQIAFSTAYQAAMSIE
ncbi:MAG: NAD(P)/FAD-dependent oxidoreductase [Eubacteriales bacterium]|uniref:NAD(P)/FAD-dependent oxidoreductase n=1 Tax=Fenollaria sp. TaxID=1965292 RepID=UPI002A754725|nr:NAD(P)/FAD-dependent oxidoreductase [Fenollaria sp.]MDD7339231.1 NAD(P)/FAD-dependent oxidoreductase [Eubacteriales bacterium]MDY3106227.1 NAD(P)/FAD-dependent oxidoreductase [Fenollaria sp.]